MTQNDTICFWLFVYVGGRFCNWTKQQPFNTHTTSQNTISYDSKHNHTIAHTRQNKQHKQQLTNRNTIAYNKNQTYTQYHTTDKQAQVLFKHATNSTFTTRATPYHTTDKQKNTLNKPCDTITYNMLFFVFAFLWSSFGN